MASIDETLAKGYADSAERLDSERKAKRDKEAAEDFEPNEQYESLIALRESDRAAFDLIAAGVLRIALAGYEKAKAAAAAA